MSRSIVRLRSATRADMAAIEALVESAFGGYVERIGRKPQPMLTDYRAVLSEHQLWLLEEEEDTPIAMLELVPHQSYLLIATVAVSPAHQRFGLGRRLMAFAETEAKRQRRTEIRLYTNERLTENIAFYEHLGYRESHREPVSGGTNLVHMVKHLST